jgi:hypothetical protein
MLVVLLVKKKFAYIGLGGWIAQVFTRSVQTSNALLVYVEDQPLIFAPDN